MPGIIQPSLQHQVCLGDTLLQKFCISRNGFIPSHEPLKVLPDPYYSPWELLAQHLPEFIHNESLRGMIDRLDILSVDRLRSEDEWRRAYSMLGFLAHGYIWGGDRPCDVLPPAITCPLLKVSEHLELPPVATYAGLNLWNFTSCGGSDFTDIQQLKANVTFTGTHDESWFYMLSVAFEVQGAYILPLMVQAIKTIRIRDYAVIVGGLKEMVRAFAKLGNLLDRMYEHCRPTVFYNRIRPFLAGSKNMESVGLPNGIFYDEGDGKGSWRQLRGGSNGQSSLIQFFDVVLGIEHSSEGSKSPDKPPLTPTDGSAADKEKLMTFHEEVRSYTPGPHRRFLEYVSRLGSLREFALSSSEHPEHRQFQIAYQSATHAFTEFRNTHLKLVTRYIIIPSKAQITVRAVNLASASANSEKRGESELTGAGGTALIPFLKQTRDVTKEAGNLGLRRVCCG